MRQTRSAKKKPQRRVVIQRRGQAAEIMRAALGCIKQFGAARTTMADVAARAKVGRQTVYRIFATRAALFDAVALQRLTEMREPMRRCLSDCTSLESAIVRGTSGIRSVARKDSVFMDIVDSAGDRGLERYLLNLTPSIDS